MHACTHRKLIAHFTSRPLFPFFPCIQQRATKVMILSCDVLIPRAQASYLLTHLSSILYKIGPTYGLTCKILDRLLFSQAGLIKPILRFISSSAITRTVLYLYTHTQDLGRTSNCSSLLQYNTSEKKLFFSAVEESRANFLVLLNTQYCRFFLQNNYSEPIQEYVLLMVRISVVFVQQ